MLIYCCAVILVYNSETSNKGISNGLWLERGEVWMI